MNPRGWLLGALLAAASSAAHALPSFADVKAAHRPSDLTLLDRHGTPIQTLRIDKTVRRLHWVPLHEMSPALLHAVVLSEDQRFWQHGGIDWQAVAGSAFGNLWNTRTRGASTLTMQLAGLLDAGLARPLAAGASRSVPQKIGQALAASELESGWKKHEILEAYLNSVPLRGELVGIAALAQTLFGKHPGGLDAQEAAITAALIRAPNAADEAVARRACGVLKLMQWGCEGLPTLTATALVRRGGMPLGEQIAPHFARWASSGAGGSAQRSTLDAGVQRVALRALRSQLAELAGRQVEDGAVLVLDNTSGEVLAWVGSAGAGTSDAPEVDAVLARRQPGSTLKPFVYALAFERRLIGPQTLLDDSPAQIGTQAGLYLPQNYDRGFKGLVSARTALASSLNVPAVRVSTLLPPEALFQKLNALGLALPESGGYYGHSLAIGSADVTLLGLTNAYRSLANGGLHTPVAVSRQAAPPRSPGSARPAQRPGAVRVFDAATSHIVTDILADNSARALTFGLDSALATRGFAAVKTGTSKDLRDNWCIGFSSRYTVGVWVGNAGGEPMHEVSGVSGAAPVWRAVMAHLHRDEVSRAPAAPAAVERAALRHQAAASPIGITSPADGSIFALDPDVPPAAQRLTFEGEHGIWRLDGKRLGSGRKLSWAPWPGRHELELLGPGGQSLQRVRFEVRGASVKGSR